MTETIGLKRKASQDDLKSLAEGESNKSIKTVESINSDLHSSEDTRNKGMLRVKPEYRLLSSSKDTQNSNYDDDGAEAAGVAHTSGSSKHKNRGQNKPKDRKQIVQHDSIRLCNKFATGEQCNLGSNCKYSHDIQAYLAEKEPDLGPVCPQFALLGECKFGIKCRFSKAHTDAEGNQMVAEKKLNEDQFIKNCSTKSIIQDIKQKNIDCTRSKEFIQWWSAEEIKLQQRLNELKKRKEEPRVDQDGVTEPVTEPVAEPVADNQINIESTPATQINSTTHKEKLERIEAGAEATLIPLRPNEKKKIDFRGKSYLAPLTTVGNIPFRRVCKSYGVDITCSEMAIARQLLRGSPQEWALTRRHASEDMFGIQLASNDPTQFTQTVEILSQKVDCDFIDLNMGCPIDTMTKSGNGSALLERKNKVRGMLLGAVHVSSVPITIKMRIGLSNKKKIGHKIIPLARDCGVAAITVHGRSKEQRYTKLSDWDYTMECAKMTKMTWHSPDASTVTPDWVTEPPAFFGNGDVFSPQEYWDHVDHSTDSELPLAGIMVGRGALSKPWIFKEIKERKLWDISSGERLDMLKDFTKFGLECWGSDTMGVNTTRKFMCEWLSFLYRYVPVGILEVLPQRVNERPEQFVGRNDLETLMASDNSKDWIKITEMLLGPAPESFQFIPKHKSNSYTPQG
ncbi:tRNA-dihydrouridine synthase 3 [Batrachochytrium dendrobatidis]